MKLVKLKEKIDNTGGSSNKKKKRRDWRFWGRKGQEGSVLERAMVELEYRQELCAISIL